MTYKPYEFQENRFLEAEYAIILTSSSHDFV